MKPTIQVESQYSGPLFSLETLSWPAGDGQIVHRDVIRHPGAVLIVPVLDESRLVMIRNYRIAVDDRLLEFPAGTLEPGESPETTARRELEEECGHRASRMELLGEFYTSPGFADERMHVFIGTDLESGDQKLEPHEDIEVEIVTVDDALAMSADGRMVDAKSIAALLMWERRRLGFRGTLAGECRA